jgi:hypothetical protein
MSERNEWLEKLFLIVIGFVLGLATAVVLNHLTGAA